MDIGLKNTPYFGKDEEFFAVINVPFPPDFKEWMLERKFRDPFYIIRQIKEVHQA